MDTNSRYLLGVEGLEDLVPLLPGSIVVLAGPPGVGKTTIALSTLCRNALERGVKGLYITIAETREKLLLKAEKIGCNIKELMNKGLVKVTSLAVISGSEFVDHVTKYMLAEDISGDYDIVVLDNVTAVLKALKEYDRQRTWLQTTLYNIASGGRKILILIAEAVELGAPELLLAEYVADVALELEEKPNPRCPVPSYDKYLFVRKHRFAPTPGKPFLIAIDEKGVRALGHIRGDKAQKLLAKRKPLKVECELLRRILGDRIESGTLILLLNKKPGQIWISHKLRLLDIFRWMVYESGLTAAYITYDKNKYDAAIKALERTQHPTKQALKVIEYVDPCNTTPGYLTTLEHDLITREEIDILCLDSVEKLAETLGFECITPYLNTVFTLQKNLGVTTLRIYNLYNESRYPLVYTLWSDVVIEIDLDEKGRILYRFMKAPGQTLPKPPVIYEEELEECTRKHQC